MERRMALQGASSFSLGASHWYPHFCQSLAGTRQGNLIFSEVALGLLTASVLQNSGSEPGAVLLSGWLTVLGNIVGLVGGDLRDAAEHLQCTGQPLPRRMFWPKRL